MCLETQLFSRKKWDETGSKQGNQPVQRREGGAAWHKLQEAQGSSLAKHRQGEERSR